MSCYIKKSMNIEVFIKTVVMLIRGHRYIRLDHFNVSNTCIYFNKNLCEEIGMKAFLYLKFVCKWLKFSL
jgi:hypothetical protein